MPTSCPSCDGARQRRGDAVSNANKQVELAFGGLHLGDIDVEETNRITLEAQPLRLVALDVW